LLDIFWIIHAGYFFNDNEELRRLVCPGKLGEILAFSAYCTRVGSGPFPTELLDEEIPSRKGHEWRATGRPRDAAGSTGCFEIFNHFNGVT
jgi:hypothetical protein